MNIWLILIGVLVLLALFVLRRKLGAIPMPAFLMANTAASHADTQAEQPLSPIAALPKDVVFRAKADDGPGGAIVGDVLCADGVYLPDVWEQDFHASYDGRWISTGSQGGGAPRLVDRKTKQSWTLTSTEVSALDEIYWRLPRWEGEELNESGLADDAHTVLSDSRFTAWLNNNVSNPGMELTPIGDLFVPWDCVQSQSETVATPPVLPAAPQGNMVLGVKRHLPASLRNEHNPLAIYNNPQWQLLLNGEAQPWLLEAQAPVVWRKDGQAFALYAYALVNGSTHARLQLAVWSVARGWQWWSETQPSDLKPWKLDYVWPRKGDPQPLYWEGENSDILLQCVQMDVPELERLHDGTHISSATDGVQGRVGSLADGRVQLQNMPRNILMWRRDLANPQSWQAQSLPVAGKPLVWKLIEKDRDDVSSPAYQLRWGHTLLEGRWELEHIVVQRRWAILLRHGPTDAVGADIQLNVWDGSELRPVALHWPVMRMCPAPLPNGGLPPRVKLLMLTGSVTDSKLDIEKGSWRWPVKSLQDESAELLRDAAHATFYEMREIAPDAGGHWNLLPRLRKVSQIQHPCADGDYAWLDVQGGDDLWWWGGVQQPPANRWRSNAPRRDGVYVTLSGSVLCGAGPAACEHPQGDGWVMLESPEEHHEGELADWKLIWLHPKKRLVRTLTLRAEMPVLKRWDKDGIHWVDEHQHQEPEPAQQTEADAATEPEDDVQTTALSQSHFHHEDDDLPTAVDKETANMQIVLPEHWGKATVQDLQQGPFGLWLRKQDMKFADAVRERDDWPWQS